MPWLKDCILVSGDFFEKPIFGISKEDSEDLMRFKKADAQVRIVIF